MASVQAKNAEINVKTSDFLQSRRRNRCLQEENNDIKKYMQMKDQEIEFIKSKRKDLCISVLAENVKVDQNVDVGEGGLEPPELPRLRCRNPSELLINPGNNGVAIRENNWVADVENNAQDGRTDNSIAEKDTDGGVDDICVDICLYCPVPRILA